MTLSLDKVWKFPTFSSYYGDSVSDANKAILYMSIGCALFAYFLKKSYTHAMCMFVVVLGLVDHSILMVGCVAGAYYGYARNQLVPIVTAGLYIAYKLGLLK